jgi:hypothetical protein
MNSRLIGTSSFLPVIVRGIAGTCTISSGTWRGEAAVRIASATALRAASSRIVSPSRETNSAIQ